MRPENLGTVDRSRILHTCEGEVIVVPTSFFVDKLLPPLHPRINMEWFFARNAFKHAVKKQGRGHTLARLEEAIYRISTVIGLPDPTYVFDYLERDPQTYQEDADEEETSDQELKAKSAPVAFFLPKDATQGVPQWTEIAVSGVYQKYANRKSVKDNVANMLRCIKNSMNCDPARLFAYGFTLEDQDMKLWYCDRSQIIVSARFNFVEDLRTLVHFVLAIAFAKREDLGWDPTMTIVHLAEKTQYDIAVRISCDETKTYRTVDLLSNAHSIVGRGTRVWKAVELVDGQVVGEPVALKDTWVKRTREREAVITKNLHQAILSSHPDKSYGDFFLTVACHGDVFVDGAQEITPKFSRPAPEKQQDLETASGSIIESQNSAEPEPQIHYRIVFNELGTPLNEIMSLRLVFRVLHDAIKGIEVMHDSNYIHRDISPGNILVYKGRGILADLEYAVDISKQDPTDTVGTIGFAAIEVIYREYAFWTPHIESFSLADMLKSSRARGTSSAADAEEELRVIEILSASEGSMPKFRQNPLHDLESLWWVAVYFIVNREVVPNPDEDDTDYQRRDSQRRFADTLFSGKAQRRRVIASDGYFMSFINRMHPRVDRVFKFLEEARFELHHFYSALETPERITDIEPAITLGLGVKLAEILAAIRGDLEKEDIMVRRFTAIDWRELDW